MAKGTLSAKRLYRWPAIGKEGGPGGSLPRCQCFVDGLTAVAIGKSDRDCRRQVRAMVAVGVSMPMARPTANMLLADGLFSPMARPSAKKCFAVGCSFCRWLDFAIGKEGSLPMVDSSAVGKLLGHRQTLALR